MPAKCPRHLLHRHDPRAHRSRAPLVQKRPSPGRALILPETLKVVPHQVRLHTLQVVPHQLAHLCRLLFRQVLRTLQQAPPRVLEHFPATFPLQLPCFLRTHLIELFVELLHHVKTVQNVHRARGLLRDHRHVVAPHVRTDELQPLKGTGRNRREEPSQALLRAVLGDVQQTPTLGIDLVHQRQVLVTPPVSDFIDPDRFNPLDFTVNHAPVHDPLHRPKHSVPTRPEDRPGLLPTQAFGPGGEEDSVAVRRAVLTICPGNPLDGHAAAPAVDTPHAVEEEHRNGPQRDELEPPLTQGVVLGTFATALAADRSATAVGMDVDQDFAAIVSEAGVAVNETLLLFDAVEDSPELHLVRCEA